MTVEIRPVPEADQRRWLESVIAPFGEDVNEEQWKLDQKTLEPNRILGGYNGDKIVGGGAVISAAESKRPKEPSVPLIDFAGKPADRSRFRGPFGTTRP